MDPWEGVEGGREEGGREEKGGWEGGWEVNSNDSGWCGSRVLMGRPEGEGGVEDSCVEYPKKEAACVASPDMAGASPNKEGACVARRKEGPREAVWVSDGDPFLEGLVLGGVFLGVLFLGGVFLGDIVGCVLGVGDSFLGNGGAA